MTGPITGRNLVAALIEGGERAVTDFSYISGGECFDEAPEYFLTTYAARFAGRLEKAYCLLEVPVGMARKEAGAIRRGRPANHERINGRFDIVLYWGNGAPRAAVEVKSPICSVTSQSIIPDVDRLCSALFANNQSSFQFGVFLFYASVSKPVRKHDNANQKMRDLLNRIEWLVKNRVLDFGGEACLLSGSIHDGEYEDDRAWCIAACVITRRGGSQAFLSI